MLTGKGSGLSFGSPWQAWGVQWAAGLGSRPLPHAVHSAFTVATHLPATVAVPHEETEAWRDFSLASSPSESSRSWAANWAPGSSAGLGGSVARCPRAWPAGGGELALGAGRAGGQSPRGLAAEPCLSRPLGPGPQAGVSPPSPGSLAAGRPEGRGRAAARNKPLSPPPPSPVKRVNFFKPHLLSYCLFSGSSSNFRCPPQIRRGSPVIPERSAIHLKFHHSPHKQAKAAAQACGRAPACRLLPL